jgi:hypothetical protein
MKLRIYRDSLRFRLSPSDVARLNSVGVIAETTGFAQDAEFSYSLLLRPDIDAMHATLASRAICVEIPSSLARDWSGSQTVGVRHAQPLGKGKTLEILIEKDFECLEGQVNEPEVVLYPNPNKKCSANEPTAGC